MQKTDKITIAPESKPSPHVSTDSFDFSGIFFSSFLLSYRTLNISKGFFAFCFSIRSWNIKKIYFIVDKLTLMCQKSSSLRPSLKPKRKTQTVLSLHFQILLTCIFCHARICPPVIRAIWVIKYFRTFQIRVRVWTTVPLTIDSPVVHDWKH